MDASLLGDYMFDLMSWCQERDVHNEHKHHRYISKFIFACSINQHFEMTCALLGLVKYGASSVLHSQQLHEHNPSNRVKDR
jgi:hypothetical protein